MTAPPEFFPPRLTPWVVRCVQAIALPLGRWMYWVRLDLSEGDRKTLETLRDQRVLLLPNHPTFHDPIVMFLLSAATQQPFHFLAALETFIKPKTMFMISPGMNPIQGIFSSEWFQRLVRAFFQRLGMYSIRRGLADRASISQTIDLLATSGTHLVIFPEGGCSFQNDTVMPFRPGGIQLAFQALNRFAKKQEPLPDLYVLPIAIKYFYAEDPQPIIEATLARLETTLQVTPDAEADHYSRLRTVAGAVLNRLEQEYHLTTVETSHQPWNQRIEALKLAVLQACEEQLGINANPEEFIRERVYRIQYAVRGQGSDDATGETTGDQFFSTQAVEKATARLLNFDAIYDGYVAENPTPERFLDTLVRLEREVFDIDQPPPKGHRQAVIQLGEPINLKDSFAAYRSDRSGTVDGIVATAQQRVQKKLMQLRDRSS